MYKTLSNNNFYHPHSNMPAPIQRNQKSYTNLFYLLDDNEGNTLRKYQILLEDFNRNLMFFEWRKKIHHPIPKITSIKHGFDSRKRNLVQIFCQHISINFAQIPLLKIQQLIYCLSQMLLGYQQIFSKLGFVCIQSDLYGLNKKGQILIWISQNFILNASENRKITKEKQIVQKVIEVLQNKAFNKNDIFFYQLSKIQKSFKKVLEFIMVFKNKNKLKITPKILCYLTNFKNQKMLTSNTFSNSSQNQPSNQMLISQNLQMKNSGHISSSHSQSQFLSMSRMNQNQFSLVNKKPENRTSILQNSTPKNITSSIYQKSGPKINFSYSQKRSDLSTPKQSVFLRDYTSDRIIGFGSKAYPEFNQIQQFTLEDPKKSQILISEKQIKKRKYQRKIVQTYSIYYIPQIDTAYVKTELDLKKSSTSEFSQSSFSDKGRLGDKNICYNKTSMTTNHRSNVTQSYQSLGKQSNDQDYSTRKNDLFSSNNSHKTTYSIIKSSFVENEPGRNNNSFVILGNYDKSQQSSLNHPALVNNSSQKSQVRKDMYTFGGLIKVNDQPKLPIKNQMKSIFQQIKNQPNESSYQNTNTFQQVSFNSKTLSNQIHTKSIQELYNNLYFNSEKKSMIMQDHPYQIKLSPVKQQSNSHSNIKVQRSIVIGKNFHSKDSNDSPLAHKNNIGFKAQKQVSVFSSPKLDQKPTIMFDYNQWRGIKGLLNQSNCQQLKQSIHCGPQIRTPINFKLELLDKFGRQIAQSIMPSTPSYGQHSRANSIYTAGTDQQQNLDFY